MKPHFEKNGVFLFFLFIYFNMKVGLVDSGIGVIPFLKEIIKDNIANQYYIYIDKEFFPYGEKTESELLERLNQIINYFSNLGINHLLICCNTLSYIYLKYKPYSNFKVSTILEINLSKKKFLLTTSFLSSKLDTMDGTSLASFIETNDTTDIINLIKGLNRSEFVLSCTHYHLIKSLFYIYRKKALSYEKELVKSIIKDGNEVEIYLNPNSEENIKKYFKKIKYKIIS